jgi:hypothetical protein
MADKMRLSRISDVRVRDISFVRHGDTPEFKVNLNLIAQIDQRNLIEEYNKLPADLKKIVAPEENVSDYMESGMGFTYLEANNNYIMSDEVNSKLNELCKLIEDEVRHRLFDD